MKRALLSVLAYVGLQVSSAMAVVPEQGIWYNPSESGRGYGIEMQDDFIFVTYYGYSQNGSSAFFTSGGRLNASTGRADLDFISFSDGQCFGCAYRAPVGTLLGTARITFSSSMRGSLQLPGGVTIPIQRQLFFGAEPRTSMYGTWHLTSGALGLYFGDALWIQQENNSLAGGFQGRIIDGSSQRILVGSPMSDGRMSILVDSSSNYYTFFVFNWSVNRWTGRSWTYLKTAQPTGNGLSFFGSRLLGKAHSSSSAFNTPTTSTPAAKTEPTAAESDALDQAQALRTTLGVSSMTGNAKSAGTISEVEREMAEQLRSMLSRGIE